MKILVLGSTGFLGSYLCYCIDKLGFDVIGVSRSPGPYVQTFIQNEDASKYSEIILQQNVDVVINTVAMTSHKVCEDDPSQAFWTNASYAGSWAKSAELIGARFVQISTDAVFDGKKTNLYQENDLANPLSAYGRSKLHGEKLVIENSPAALILRTNFFGWSRNGSVGILDFFIDSFFYQREIVGFQDYIVSSLYMGDMVDALFELLNLGATGTFHLVSSSPLSKYLFGIEVARQIGLPSACMKPGYLSEFSMMAMRGNHLGLSCAKTELILGRKMPRSSDGITRALAERDVIINFYNQFI